MTRNWKPKFPNIKLPDINSDNRKEIKDLKHKIRVAELKLKLERIENKGVDK